LLDPLPVDAVLPDVISALRRHRAAVLQAEPGAGKTTRVPPALLDAGLAASAEHPGRILVLEPRRVAARAACRRIAEERGWRVGEEVGYQVRFDRRDSVATRILFVTAGVLVQRLQTDPFLEDVAAVIFDEFHERALDLDLAFAMARRVQREARPELLLLAMSATLEVGPLTEALGGAPLIASAGRVYPVAIDYADTPQVLDGRAAPARVAAGVRTLLAAGAGDVLAFLPGAGEIRATAELLAPLAERSIDVLQLYGDLAPEEQDRALRRGLRRRVVLATNIAETSLTLDGVDAVVDSGLAREMRFDPAIGIDRLEIVRISKASAAQRAGRAGRQGPGRCLRLWTRADELAMQPFAQPEVRRVDLAWATLQLLAWGERDPAAFPWFERPSAAALAQALTLLRALGAADEGGIAPEGRRLARLPLHPRLARLVLAGAERGAAAECALVAALLADPDPLRRPAGGPRTSRSDVLDRLEGLSAVRSSGGARAIFQARDQILSLVERMPDAGASKTGRTRNPTETGDAVRFAVLQGFSDRVARRRETGSPRAVMVGGRGVRLAPDSAVTAEELFVCVVVDGGGDRPEALVRLASGVDRADLPAARLTTRVAVAFDAARERVVARRAELFDDLVLAEIEIPAPAEAAARALTEAALADLDRAFGLATEPAAGLLARWEFLAAAMPELALPAPRAALADLLPGLAAGRRAFADLRALDVGEILLGTLSRAQRQGLEREAPERLAVPSGSAIRIAYAAGQPPVLAARIQELFGLAETPRLAGGRVPVLLHLLAPSGRPQQVTSDLASFWNGAYREVKKELAGRYPKHSWPDDPWTATAERRPKRKRQP